MSSWRRLVTRGISEAVALARTGAAPRAGLRVLMYHSVGPIAASDKLDIYSISPKLFSRQMAFLTAGFANQFIGLGDKRLAGDQFRIAITFDDGYRNNLHCAAPILQEYGIPFTVFVCTGFLQENSVDYLSRSELKELASLRGVTIGSHGTTHARLTTLDSRSLRQELITSKAILEDITGHAVNTLSYPHGAVDRRVRNAAEEAGYAIGACSRFDINSPNRDPLVLCRTDILGLDSVRVFKQKLHGDWDWYRWRGADIPMR